MFVLSSDLEQSKHVTYLHNGAVISNVPNGRPTVVRDNQFLPPSLPSLENQNKQEDAFVIQNPLIGENQNQVSNRYKDIAYYM